MTLGKIAALLVMLALMASSLTMVNATSADNIPKPSVPEFSVSIVAHPYDVPEKTTTTIDQYTGKETITTIPGYLVENKSIEVKIQNQPFTPFTLNSHQGCRYDNDRIITFIVNESIAVNHYFLVQVRGHFGDEDDWRTVGSGYTIQSDSQNTIINVKLDKYPSDAVLDFKVQAATGYLVSFFINIQLSSEKFFGMKSDWSNIHTLNLTDGVETTLLNTSVSVVNDQLLIPIATPAPSPAESTQNPASTSSLSPITTPASTPTSPEQIEQTETDSGFNWETTTIAIISITGVILVAALLISPKRNHQKS